MSRRAMRKAQKFVEEENVQELFLTKQEVMSLISILASYGEKLNPLTEGLILHYLPVKHKTESALLKGVMINRLATLIHVEPAPITDNVFTIDIDQELIRVAVWLDICDN